MTFIICWCAYKSIENCQELKWSKSELFSVRNFTIIIIYDQRTSGNICGQKGNGKQEK